jgi:hypothetical protein
MNDCGYCGGKGWYKYDDIHCRNCEVCCDHSKGWFEVTPSHGRAYIEGADNGCCVHCGMLRRVAKVIPLIMEQQRIHEQKN